jgi:hypothetical protein
MSEYLSIARMDPGAGFATEPSREQEAEELLRRSMRALSGSALARDILAFLEARP